MLLNWDAIGAIGELLGSMVVLATLGYLAVQTRSINKQSQAEARYAFVEAMGHVNMVIAQSPQTASIWRKGLEAIDTLTEDERMQFFMFIGQYANCWSVMHQLRESDLLPDAQWVVVRNDLLSIMGSGGGRYFWEMAGAAYDPAFSDFVNSALEGAERPYDMASMAERRNEQP